MTHLFKPGALVFDIGAHYGESARKFRDWGAGRVIAVEPNPHSFAQLMSSTTDEGIIPINCALDFQPCFLDLSTNERDDGCSTTVPMLWCEQYPQDVFKHVATVPALTMQCMVQKFGEPDYVKVDVEGNEYRVLLGMDFKPECLTFEFHRHPTTGHEATLDVLLLLEQYGYRHCCITGDDLNGADPTSSLGGLILGFKLNIFPDWGNITVR